MRQVREKARTRKSWRAKRPPKFHVGDRVKVRFGDGLARARIVEDRGNIGVGGRRIVRIKLAMEEPEVDMSFEVPAEELTPC